MNATAVFLCLPALFATLCAADNRLETGAAFLRTHMPEQDRQTVTAPRLEKEVSLALKARDMFAWAQAVPWEIYENDVLPYAVLDEPRDEWREQFQAMFTPVVSSCKTGSEAALTISARIQQLLNVTYSTERRAPNQGVRESLASGKVSCTGQSILLICALRSVGIPARMAGVITWNHVRGNHNWVEAWCDGSWKMLEYNEKDFNTPWVMSSISMLDPTRPENAIFATSWKTMPDGSFFPLVWKAHFKPETMELIFPSESRTVPAVNMTGNYLKLAADWSAAQPGYTPGSKLMLDITGNVGGKRQRLSVPVVLKSEQGHVLAEGMSPGPSDDMRKFLELRLPSSETKGILEFRLPNGQVQRQLASHTQAPVQILHVTATAADEHSPSL